jgi:SAM-dependent methyltransferase
MYMGWGLRGRILTAWAKLDPVRDFVRYGGWRFQCPICGGRFRRLIADGLHARVLAELQVVGGGPRPNCECPRCHCLDRERLVYLYLKRRTDIFRQPLNMLHVAPERNLMRLFKACPNIRYVSLDLAAPLAAVKADITRMPFEDTRFDAVVCNHVLEHVPDDRRAMSEVFRVLRPGGWAILQVPIARSLKHTDDGPVADPEERYRRFGGPRHLRLYAMDYADRLRNAGFGVQAWSFEQEYGASQRERYSLIEGEDLYVCTRPAKNSKHQQDAPCDTAHRLPLRPKEL